MKTHTLITLLLALGLLTACAEMNPHPMNRAQAVQSAETKDDHEALAKHYDEAAVKCRLKLMNTRNSLTNTS
jgi:outer membrane biogenesis lipoprotein LolB